MGPNVGPAGSSRGEEPGSPAPPPPAPSAEMLVSHSASSRHHAPSGSCTLEQLSRFPPIQRGLVRRSLAFLGRFFQRDARVSEQLVVEAAVFLGQAGRKVCVVVRQWRQVEDRVALAVRVVQKRADRRLPNGRAR